MTGTHLYLKGVPAIAIKDRLRHSDIRVTTDYYIGSDSEFQKAQIEKLSKPRPRVKTRGIGVSRIYSIHPRDKSRGFLRGGVKDISESF